MIIVFTFILHYIILDLIVLYYIVVYYIIVHYVILYYIVVGDCDYIMRFTSPNKALDDCQTRHEDRNWTASKYSMRIRCETRNHPPSPTKKSPMKAYGS